MFLLNWAPDCTDEYCGLAGSIGGGKCLPRLPEDATCITDAWCSSGACTDNVCEAEVTIG